MIPLLLHTVYSGLTLYMMLILVRWAAPWLQIDLWNHRLRWIGRLTDPALDLVRRKLPPLVRSILPRGPCCLGSGWFAKCPLTSSRACIPACNRRPSYGCRCFLNVDQASVARFPWLKRSWTARSARGGIWLSARSRNVGFHDPRVLEAMRQVPRHQFVSEESRPCAYDDRPLSIGYGQTISQPYMVGIMTEVLQVRPDSHVLEVGTGSGYQAAVLARLAASVVSVERVAELAVVCAETTGGAWSHQC